MPLPTLLCIALGSGIAAALAARSELRVSPRAAFLTTSFAAYVLFAALVLVPISLYFYLFHGDWFLLYFVDVREVPSAVELLAFVVEGAIGAAGFVVGAACVRSQRERVAVALAVATLALAFVVVFVAWDRLAVVGTFVQYQGDFGLRSYGGPLMTSAVVMGLLLSVGLGFLLLRLNRQGRAE